VLQVKVDAKTKSLLDEYNKKKKEEKAQKKEEREKEEPEEGEERGSDSEEGELDEFTLREDRVAKAGLDAIMREYGDEINKELPMRKSSVTELFSNCNALN
jgi:RNA-binding protein 25